ncbi:MAG TPA: glycosyltransferase [Blastocatellia bacterium]|nr:glycosyltransferase [Blastocatellia bacterium]
MLTHPQHREEIEAYLAEHPNPNLKFGWVTLPSIIDPWVPGKKDHGLAIHLHYLVWQYLVYGEALRLHQTYGFDVVHHVSWGTISAPPQLWRLPIPFVWGPVGGGQTFPRDFRDYFKDRIGSEFIRSLRIRLLPWSPTLRKAAQGSQLLLSTNRETSTLMRRVGGDHVRDAHDNAVAEHMLLDRIPPRNHGGDLRLLWAGRVVPSKGLQLGIEALAQVKDAPVRLSVAGTGSQQPELEALARELGVGDRVEFLGQVPWVEMPSVFQSADAFLFTSLRDSMGSVTLEAMAQALPIIALDHQGVALLVPEEAGIKVPVTTPAMTVATLAQAIRRLAASPETRRRMGEASWNHARTQTWEHRAAQMSNWYEECVNRRGVDDMRGQYAMWSNPGNL